MFDGDELGVLDGVGLGTSVGMTVGDRLGGSDGFPLGSKEVDGLMLGCCETVGLGETDGVALGVSLGSVEMYSIHRPQLLRHLSFTRTPDLDLLQIFRFESKSDAIQVQFLIMESLLSFLCSINTNESSSSQHRPQVEIQLLLISERLQNVLRRLSLSTHLQPLVFLFPLCT